MNIQNEPNRFFSILKSLAKSAASVPVLLVAGLLLALTQGTAQATTYTFTRTTAATYAWTDTGSWDANGVPVSSNAAGVTFFQDIVTALGQPTFTINTDPAALTLNTLTLNGKGAAATANTVVNIGTAGNTWTFDGTTPTINLAGVNGTKTLSFTILPNLTLNQGLAVSGDGTAGFTFSGIISGVGMSLTKTGASTLTLTGQNTYSGSTTVSTGTLTIGGSGYLYSGNNTGKSITVSSGATLLVTSGTFDALGYGPSSAWSVSGTISATGGNYQHLPAATTLSGGSLVGAASGNINGSFFVHNGQTIIATGNSTISGGTSTIGIGSGQTLTLSPTSVTDSLKVSGQITQIGSGSLNKTGAGTLTLSGANTYSGGTTLSGGILSFANGSLGSSGSIKMNGGTLQWASGNTQDISSRLAMVNSTAATFDTGTNSVTLSTAFGGGTSGSLVKAGTGTLTLSGTNTYSGATTISNGILLVNGSLTNASHVTVASGGTLGGTGTVGVVTNNGILSPGYGAVMGTLTTSNLVLNAGCTNVFDLSGTNVNDSVAVNGNLTINGVPVVVVNMNPVVYGSYPLLVVTGTATNTVPTLSFVSSKSGVTSKLSWGGTGNKTLSMNISASGIVMMVQ